MTVPLSATSKRRIHAARFGAEFRKALESRDVSMKAIERAAGIRHTNLWSYKSGNNLPRLETALLLAEALHWPKLAEIVRVGRSAVCARPRCNQTFLNEGGSGKRFCSDDCRNLYAALHSNDFEPGGRALLDSVRAELDRVHGTTQPISRRALKAAADEYANSGSKRGMRLTTLETMLERHREAAAAFCRSCEPDGLCQNAECELRPISPLPLASEQRDVTQPVKAPGRWGGETGDAQRAAFSASLHKRWSDPQNRARMSEQSRARWAAMSPEQRSEMSRRIAAARRRKPEAAA